MVTILPNSYRLDILFVVFRLFFSMFVKTKHKKSMMIWIIYFKSKEMTIFFIHAMIYPSMKLKQKVFIWIFEMPKKICYQKSFIFRAYRRNLTKFSHHNTYNPISPLGKYEVTQIISRAWYRLGAYIANNNLIIMSGFFLLSYYENELIV